jgi:hypothetical protein
MRRARNSGLYPISEEVWLTTELGNLLAELAEAEAASKSHIMRVALERLGLAYRRRGREALRARSFAGRYRRLSLHERANAPSHERANAPSHECANAPSHERANAPSHERIDALAHNRASAAGGA